MLQSEPDIPLDQSFQISAVVISLPPVQMGVGPAALQLKQLSVKSTFRWLQFPPEYATCLLADCCVLVSLVLGMAYNAELRANRGRTLNRYAATRDWKVLRALNAHGKNRRRAANARRHLHELVLETCEEFDLDPADFRLADLESLRIPLWKMPINVNIFSHELGYQKVFSHPPLAEQYNPEHQTVNLLLAENKLTKAQHVEVIKRLGRFLSTKRKIQCSFCLREFYRYYFLFHRCKRRWCKSCHRTLAAQDDYLDFEIREERCLSDTAPEVSLKCEKCDRTCHTLFCFRLHRKECGTRAKCHECGLMYEYKVSVRGYKHRCGDRFCLTCKKYYNSYDDNTGEKHVCQLGQPDEQKYWSRSIVWDLETTVNDEGRHHANAAGATYEVDYGRFRTICFFDADMEHPMDGVESDEEFVFKYWPERIKSPPRPKVPKQIKGLFIPTVQDVSAKDARPKSRRGADVESFLSREATEDNGQEDEEEEDEACLDPIELAERRIQSRHGRI